MATILADDVTRVFEALRALPADAPIKSWWRDLPRPLWPALFRLLDLGADLPRLRDNQTLAHLEPGLWPELERVASDLLRVQRLVDQPIVPPGTEEVAGFTLPIELDAARERLDDHHCVTVDGFLEPADRARLEQAIAELAEHRAGSWGELDREEAPALHLLMERGLGSAAFRALTGFDLERDDYSLTLSLQSLDAAGIGWHRDLYWPREWVGRDVFAVFYALDGDRPEKGGAFVYHLPWHDRVYAFYRRKHQATVLWNSADPDGRILHAVAGYRGGDTARHLVILQCLRS